MCALLQGHAPGPLQAPQQYQNAPMYMHPWGNQMMYPGGPSMSMAAGNPMQMLFPGFQAPPTLDQQRPPVSPSARANPIVWGSGLSNSTGGSSTSIPGSLSVESSGSRHSGSSTMAGAYASPTGSNQPPPIPNTFHGLGTTSSAFNSGVSYQLPFMFQGGAQWPPWVGGGGGTPYTGVSHPGNVAQDTGITTPAREIANTDSEFGGGQIAVWEESKRTRQRKLQRLTKSAFHLKSSEWPMRIECDAAGEPNNTYKIFVNRVIRIVAKRWLDFNLIKF